MSWGDRDICLMRSTKLDRYLQDINSNQQLFETVGELKKGETKHRTIVEKNYDEAEGKRAAKRETRVLPIGMSRQNAHILDRFIAAAVTICCRRVLARPM